MQEVNISLCLHGILVQEGAYSDAVLLLPCSPSAPTVCSVISVMMNRLRATSVDAVKAI